MSSACHEPAGCNRVETNVMSWIKWSGLILASAACVAALLWAYGATSWATRTRKLTERLEAARVPPPVAAYDARELDGLPAPVQRYFRAVLRDGQSIVSAVSVSHSGRFNLSAVAERWKPFTSTQRVVTRRPGFVWDGRVAMLPGLTVHVHDAYIAGVGILHPALLGLFTLADLHGTGDIAEGELMRFVAEAAWYPTALLPSQGVRWEPLDARSARVTLDDEGLRLTLTFSFGDDGLIDTARAEARGRSVGERIEMTPWQGRFWNYAEHSGMKVPQDGEVAWLLPNGPRPYWRGHIESLRYELAR